jgi:hypothetical protein
MQRHPSQNDWDHSGTNEWIKKGGGDLSPPPGNHQ